MQVRAQILFIGAALIGCGGQVNGDGDAGRVGPSGVPTKPVDQLNDADRRKLCDWIAVRNGGYGYLHECPGAEPDIAFYDNVEDCMKLLLVKSCNVALYEGCALQTEAARAKGIECTAPAYQTPECQSLGNCLEGK